MRRPAALELFWDEGSGPPPMAEIAAELDVFSPVRGWWAERPGTLWVDAYGVSGRRSAGAWLSGLSAAVEQLGWPVAAVLGATAYGGALVAASLPAGAQRVVTERAAEVALWGRLPIDVLGLGDAAQRSLARFGLRFLADLARMPRRALTARYGDALQERLKLLDGAPPPWCLWRPPERQRVELEFEPPVGRSDQLLFAVKGVLEPALTALAAVGQACSHLALIYHPERGAQRGFMLRPARPSLCAETLLSLVRLRLEAQRLRAPLVGLSVECVGCPIGYEQLRLFGGRGRDLKKAAEGLDRLRAELGDSVVFQARPQARHHPKEAVIWAPHTGAWPALERPLQGRAAVRRLLAEPTEVAPPPGHGPWRIGGEEVSAVGGPYPLQQGWWRRLRADDEYLARTRSGRIFWLLFDRLSLRWWMIGWVA